MDSRVIELTPAAAKHGNLNISACGKEFFPPDVFGGSSAKAGTGVPITLRVKGIPKAVRTDIPKEKVDSLFMRHTKCKKKLLMNDSKGRIL